MGSGASGVLPRGPRPASIGSAALGGLVKARQHAVNSGTGDSPSRDGACPGPAPALRIRVVGMLPGSITWGAG